jgi:hypothetical protein
MKQREGEDNDLTLHLHQTHGRVRQGGQIAEMRNALRIFSSSTLVTTISNISNKMRVTG